MNERELKTNRNPWIIILFYVFELFVVIFAFVNFGVVMSGEDNPTISIVFVVLSILSIVYAIYLIVMYYQMVEELNIACLYKERDEMDKSPNYIFVVLLGVITCGIYMMYWYYKQGNRLKSVSKKYGDEIADTGTGYLLWLILGQFLLGVGSFICMFMFMKNVNKICRMYNDEVLHGNSYNYDRNSYDKNNYDKNNYDKNNYAKNDLGNGGNYISSDEADTRRSKLIEKGNGNSDIGAIRKGGIDVTSPYNRNQGDIDTVYKYGKIVGIKGQYANASIDISPREDLFIGRDDASVNLVLHDSDVTRVHCRVRYNDNQNCYYIKDMSKNGVFFENGNRFEKDKETRCERGTRIYIASEKNEFELQ